MIINKKELPQVEPVELKEICGLRPGVIILIVLILALLAAFFLLCVLPGLVSKGGYVRFSLNTSGTAVMMDGKYIGSSEGSVYYLPKGDHEFTFSINGIEAGSVKEIVKGNILFSLFHRKVSVISFTLNGTEALEEALKEDFLSSVPLWSRTYEWDSVNHFPPLFSSFASNAAALGFDDVSKELYQAALDITSPEMYSDFLSSLSVLSSSSVGYLSPELSVLLDVLASLYGDGDKTGKAEGLKPAQVPELNDGYYWYEGQSFTMGKSGGFSYPDIIDSPVDVTTSSFAIAARPVSEYEYALFVSENPYWASSNSAQLIEDGMADENYLKGIVLSPSIHSTKPVRGVSYYAAEAYCEWLSGKTGLDIALPTEAEWTLAAYSASDKPYVKSLSYVDTEKTSPSFMLGGVWEITSTPFHALSRLSDYSLATSLPSPDIIVKGGSYINSGIDADTVGVMGKSSTSAFTGFRVGIR